MWVYSFQEVKLKTLLFEKIKVKLFNSITLFYHILELHEVKGMSKFNTIDRYGSYLHKLKMDKAENLKSNYNTLCVTAFEVLWPPQTGNNYDYY